MKNGDECAPVCPSDATTTMDDEDCAPAGTGEEGPGAVNRPTVVAGVEAFAPQPPPAGVEQYAGPSSSAGTPAGVLPMTGAGALMNTLAAAGLGLLVLGAAALLRSRTHGVDSLAPGPPETRVGASSGELPPSSGLYSSVPGLSGDRTRLYRNDPAGPCGPGHRTSVRDSGEYA